MRKIKNILFAALALLGTAACTELEHFRYDPVDGTAPVLQAIPAESGTLAEGVDLATAGFSPASYGFDAAVRYTLYADIDPNFAAEKRIGAVNAPSTSIAIPGAVLNNVLVSAGCAPGVAVTVYFRVKSALQGESGAVGGTGGELVSNAVSLSVTPYEAEKEYARVWVLGGFCGWSHDSAQHLFNYDEDDVKYEAVVDYGEDHADNPFKLTGAASWDKETGNWGVENKDAEAEAASIQLLNGSNDNITQYTEYRYYHWSFNKTTLLLTKDYGFNSLGLIGVNGDWDNDIAMSFNPATQRFYADVDAPSETTFKVRSDAKPDGALNIGGSLAKPEQGSNDNLPMKAGKWRVYVDVNDLDGIRVLLNADMYGKEEGHGGGEEPSKPAVWSLVGTLNGSSWDVDTDLAELSGDLWVVRNVTLTASDEFKIRADHKWDEAYGGPEENAQSTIDPANPYGVFKPELGTAFEAKDKNIAVGAAGSYDVTFDYAAKTILVEEHKAVYSLIGEINGDSWKKDVVMTQDGDVWTSPVVNITGGFKIRYDYSWDDGNTYGVGEGFTPTVGTAFTAVQPGANITVPEAGDYKVIFNSQDKSVTIAAVAFPEQLFMIGEEFGGWDWSSPGIVSLVPVHSGEGQFWTVRYFSAGKGFKFNSKKAWGGDFWGLKTNDGFTEAGGNCTVSADGFYMVHVDFKRERVHVEPARIYGIGDCFGGWEAEKETALFAADGKTLKATLSGSGELRMFAASSIADTDWWTREFIILEGKIVYRGTGDDQQRVPCTAGQVVTLDPDAGTGTIL